MVVHVSDGRSERFDRLPQCPSDRYRQDQPTRNEITEWWTERFGIPASVFAGHSFWERGKGKIWAFRGRPATPIRTEGLGMTAVRTNQRHWKPTTNAIQRFGQHATKNVLTLPPEAARAFVAGEDQAVSWEGSWGYLAVAAEIADGTEPLGVGLYIDGELRSTVPKGRRRTIARR